MAKKFSSFKGHQLITESWRSFINESETGSPAGRNASAQDSEMELEEMSKAEADAMRGHAGQFRVLPGGGLEPLSMAAQGEIDKHALNLYRVLEGLDAAARKEIIDDIINNLQDMI